MTRRERRFTPDRQRSRPPRLLDELGQYFHLYRTRNWTELTTGVGIEQDAELCINRASLGRESRSKHYAVANCMNSFSQRFASNTALLGCGLGPER